MRTITAKEFLEEMKKDWDCVDMIYFNYTTKAYIRRWVNRETIKYDKKDKSLRFKDWKYDLWSVIPMKKTILVEKKQYSDSDITEYIIDLTDNIEITFEATKKF